MEELVNNIFNLMFEVAELLMSYDYTNIFEWQWLRFLSALISAAFIWGIVYCVSKTHRIYKGMRAFETPKTVPKDSEDNVKGWEKILEKGRSEDENERKFAIIAADSLIEKILDLAGYSGANLGERLKTIESSDLDSLNNLWEAHKIRNRIAHEAEYKLPREDAVRALVLYERALKELKYL